MIKKNIIFGIILILLVLPLVTSQTYKKGEILDLKIPFEVNGSIASENAWCNISINYPNGSYLKDNASMMNQNNGDFNITLSIIEVSTLGEYCWRAFCCDGGECAAGYGKFEITPSGFGAINSGEGIVLSLLIGSIMIFSILFFIFSFKIEFFPAKVIFMGISLILFVVVLLFITIMLSQTLGGFETIIDSYSSFLWVALFLFFLVFIFILLVLIKKSIEAFQVKRGLR